MSFSESFVMRAALWRGPAKISVCKISLFFYDLTSPQERTMFNKIAFCFVSLTLFVSSITATTLQHDYTYHLATLDDIYSVYQSELKTHPKHYCLTTGQPED